MNMLSIQVNENNYVKNPDTSDLGRRIVTSSIDLISEIGFEDFTFKKLAMSIKSTEASVYRYFESKHMLLLYLINWYWSWISFRMQFALANIESPEERLKRAVNLLTDKIEEDTDFSHINEVKLNLILITEASKSYSTKNVDDVNGKGLFSAYKSVVEQVSNIVLEINPTFKYPHMLISTVVEAAHHQRYFADHLPKLTDVIQGEDHIPHFYVQMVFSTIKSKEVYH